MEIFRFTDEFGLEVPLVQGPFGGGLSTVALTSAVSNAGGLGSFGVHHLDGHGIESTASAIREATGRPFALNLWVSDHDPGGDDLSFETFENAWRVYEPYFRELGLDRPEQPVRYHHRFGDQIDALIAVRPAAFSFVFGIPPQRILEACRRAGIRTIGAATTLAEVEALDDAKVDLIVASGFEAGGHRPSFLQSAEDSLMGTATLVQQASRKVRRPIIAAGGIVNGVGVRTMLTAGANAAQVGTAFLACEESGTAQVHRDALFSTRGRDTVLTRAYTGRLARGIPNRLVNEFHRRSASLPPFPIHAWFVGKLKAAALAANSEEFLSLYSGQGAPLLQHRRAAELIEAIRAEL